jgi:hypothetical protein
MDILRTAAQHRFTTMADKVLTPAFEKIREITERESMKASAPLSQPTVRTFKFALSENTYLLMVFRQNGVEQCETVAEFAVPNHAKVPQLQTTTDLSDADDEWASRTFEEHLDRFLDTVARSMNSDPKLIGEPAHA